MRLYFPVKMLEILEISWNNEIHEVTITPPDGCLDLTPFNLPLKAPFTISKSGNQLFTTTKEDLLKLERNVEIVKCNLCLDVQADKESLYPVAPTNIFYQNDYQIVFFAELASVYRPLPVFLSWWYEEKPWFFSVGQVPPLPQEYEGKTFVRSYAYGLFINPEMPKGTWKVRFDFPTGRNLCCLEARLLARNRPRYGESGVLFRPKQEGGKILDELVE